MANRDPSGAYKPVIAPTLLELNRPSGDAIMTSGSVGRVDRTRKSGISCSCWLSCYVAMIRILWQFLFAALDELFQKPMRIVVMPTGNGAVPVLNPSQRELRGPLQRHTALRAAIAIVYRLYGDR